MDETESGGEGIEISDEPREAVVTFRGIPMSTPPSENRKKVVTKKSSPTKSNNGNKKKGLTRPQPNPSEDGLSLLNFAQLNKETIQNTKANAKYQNCIITIEPVMLEQPRPGSPEIKFSKKGYLPSGFLLEPLENPEVDVEDAGKRLTWVGDCVLDSDTERNKEPLDPYITIPTKSCLKKKQTRSDFDSYSQSNNKECEVITVKKLIYTDDEEYILFKKKNNIKKKSPPPKSPPIKSPPTSPNVHLRPSPTLKRRKRK